MTYDVEVIEKKNGKASYVLPANRTSGIGKLYQRVLLTLLAEDGEMASFIGGGSNSSALDDSLVARERARVFETVRDGTPEDAPDDERLELLEIGRVSSGTRTTLSIIVGAASEESLELETIF